MSSKSVARWRGTPKGSKALESGDAKAPIGRVQTGSVPSGQALGPEMCSGRQPKEAEGAKRPAEGRTVRKTSAEPCRVRNHSQRQAARRRPQRLFFGASEWRCGS